MKKRSQSSFDLFILVGFIILLTAPVLVFIYDQAKNFKEIEITESLSSLKENVQLLRRLGPHSAQQVILKFPNSAKISVEGKNIIVEYNGQEFREALPVNIKSIPLSDGTQTVKLYLPKPDLAVIRGCENGYLDSGEICDTVEEGEGTGFTIIGDCIPERSSCVECKFCTCDENEDCKSRYCDISVNICKPCQADEQCSEGYECREGICTEKTETPPPVGS